MNTEDLILDLSKDAPAKTMRAPGAYVFALGLVLLVYAIGVQVYLGGFRTDLVMQLMRPAYLVEVLLLTALGAASGLAAILCMYPDGYQRRRFANLPFYLLFALAIFLAVQLTLPVDPRMVLHDGHFMMGRHCTYTIASTSFLPAILMFGLIRRGASVTPLRAGAYAVLTAFAIGCLTLRLAESNDSVLHMLVWHYTPTFLFAALGALIGRFLLRW